MQCFKNILIPINLQDPSRTILLHQALPMCPQGCKIHFLHVNTPQPLIPFDDALGTMPIYKETHLNSEEEFAILLKNANLQMDFECSISYGEVREEVSKYAEEHKIDLIITAHHKHSSLYQLFFHTTDERIIENVNIPVLVLPSF